MGLLLLLLLLRPKRLQLVQVLRQIWQAFLQTLTLADVLDDLVRLRAGVSWVTGEDLPVIEHALRECLSTGVGSIGGETERFVDGQVRLDDEHGRTGDLRVLEHVATASVQHTVDATDGRFRALDLAQVDGLHDAGRGRNVRSVQHTTGGRDDLTTTTMDSVSVQGHIVDVETNA
uniref:Secreted protein n=1 Tax=Anopheles merus TaxID=30066 RepID=A0A182VFC8_ANOME